MQNMTREPIVVIDPHMKFQPVDVREFCDALTQAADAPPRGLLPDFGGPEVLEYGEILQRWLTATGLQRSIRYQVQAGEYAAAARQGLNTNPERRLGKITWSDWLAENYPPLPSQIKNPKS